MSGDGEGDDAYLIDVLRNSVERASDNENWSPYPSPTKEDDLLVVLKGG